MPQHKRLQRRLLFLSGFNFIGLAVLCLLQNLVPETFWPVALLTLAPQVIFLLPTLALGVLSIRWQQARLLLLQLPALLFLLFAFLGLNVPIHRVDKSAATFRVMSYNIRYGSFGLGDIIETLRAEDADILCIQESLPKYQFPDPTPRLKKAFGDYHMARYGELLVLSRFPIQRFRRHRLPHRHGSGVLEAQLNVNGQTLAVLCAHFKNPIDKSFLYSPQDLTRRALVRRQQSQLLMRLVRRRSTPVIIAGDFNTPPRGWFYRRLNQTMEDAFHQAGFGFGPTFPAFFPVERIDYIWTAKGAKATNFRVLTSRASDHRPVVADLQLANQQQAVAQSR